MPIGSLVFEVVSIESWRVERCYLKEDCVPVSRLVAEDEDVLVELAF